MVSSLMISVGAADAPPGSGSKDAPATSTGKVIINGKELVSGYRILLREGIAFIPVSEELENFLGADVEQSSARGINTLSFRTLETELVFTEGETAFAENGMERQLEKPPFFTSGLLYVPLREFFVHLGCSVEFRNMNYQITKGTLFPDIISAIPEDILDGSAPATAEKRPMPEQATAPAPLEDRLFALQYTYENALEFQNVTVSGDQTQSNMIPKTEFYQRLNFRTEGKMRNGYGLTGVFKPSATTERTMNGGKIDSANLTYAKNKISLSLYDMTPKISRYVLRSYPLQGAMYTRDGRLYGWSAIWGKTPKRLRDSIYNRYEKAIILRKLKEKASLNAVYSETKDTGVDQDAERIKNSVISIYGNTVSKRLSMSGEFAMSDTVFFFEEPERSEARWIEVKYKDKRTNIVSSYERVGGGFYSETSFFTPGRREYQILAIHKPRKDLTLGGGYTSTKLYGDSSIMIPLQVSLSPFRSRPKLKLKAEKNYEKSRSDFGSRITDKRKFDLSDRVGKAKVNAAFERNRQKDMWGEWRFRSTQKYRYVTDLTKKIQMFWQFKTELKTLSSNPKKRYYQYKYIAEAGEWSELSMSVERYYNGTSNDRVTNSVTYKTLDIVNDREIALEYQYLNYREHNDNYLMVSYSFIK